MTGDDHNTAGSHYISLIYIHLQSQPEERETWTKLKAVLAPAPESAPEIATVFWTRLHNTFWHLQYVISDMHRK